MKTLFIPAKIKLKIDKSKILEISKQLPKNIAIVYSIQYKGLAFGLNAIIRKNHNITKFIQVLGCSKPSFPKATQAILLIGDGRFHALSLGFETKFPIYILNNNKLEQISQKDVQILENRQKTAYLKFLNANEIGILVSTKPGQENLKKAIELRKKLNTYKSEISGATKSKTVPAHRKNEPDFAGNKKSYLFITNNIDVSEFENFGLNSWVNTACPRIDMNDNSVININKIK